MILAPEGTGNALVGNALVSLPLAVPDLGTDPESTGVFLTELGNVVAVGELSAGTSSLGASTEEAEADALVLVGDGANDPDAVAADEADMEADGDFAGWVAELVGAEELERGEAVAPGLAPADGDALSADSLGVDAAPLWLAAGVRPETLKAIATPTRITTTVSAQATHFLFCICPHPMQ